MSDYRRTNLILIYTKLFYVFFKFVLWSAFGQPLVSLWSAFGQPLVSLWSAFGQPLVSLWSAFGQPLVSRTRGNN
jgi:hypothetical protein